MADSQIGITVPQSLIEDLVRAAVVRELGNQDKLIEGLVRAALSEPEKDRYGSRSGQTLFMKQTSKMIQDVALEAVKEWVDTSRDKIKESFRTYLISEDGEAVKKIVDSLVDGISKFSISVKFNWD